MEEWVINAMGAVGEIDIMREILSVVSSIILSSLQQIFSSPKIFIKLKNWRTKDAIKYEILARVNDDSLKNYWEKYRVMLVEMCTPVLYLFVVALVLEIFSFFMVIRENTVEGVNICIAFLLVALIVAGLIKKVRASAYVYICTVYIECILGVMLATLFFDKMENILVVLALVTSVIIGTPIWMLNKSGFYEDYKQVPVKITRIIKYIMGAIFVCKSFYDLSFNENNDVLVVWVVLSAFEYLYITYNDENKYASVTIHLDGEEKMTKDSIVQYEGERVKYRLLDGMEEIIDNSRIKYITYQREHLLRKKGTQNEKVVCTLIDNTELVYQYYCFIGDLWVGFSKTVDEKKDVLIIEKNKIKKIEVMKKSKNDTTCTWFGRCRTKWRQQW